MYATQFKFVPETLVLDVPEIDTEHEAIFHLLACLKASHLEAKPLDTRLAEQMLAELREHFATEERLAREAHQDFRAHTQKHEELLQLVGKLLAMTLEGQGNVFCLLRYVEYWCERHIGEEDRHLVSRLDRDAVRKPS